jgi:hypothetical protein
VPQYDLFGQAGVVFVHVTLLAKLKPAEHAPG